MTILPRFHASQSPADGAIVVDRETGAAAAFHGIDSAVAAAALLNARPGVVESFYWHTIEGDTP